MPTAAGPVIAGDIALEGFLFALLALPFFYSCISAIHSYAAPVTVSEVPVEHRFLEMRAAKERLSAPAMWRALLDEGIVSVEDTMEMDGDVPNLDHPATWGWLLYFLCEEEGRNDLVVHQAPAVGTWHVTAMQAPPANHHGVAAGRGYALLSALYDLYDPA